MDNLRHIAIVPDGNRRWARLHGVSTLEGHQRAALVMFDVVKVLLSKGLECLTLWGFSTDNWKRSSEEVEGIHTLLASWLESHTTWLYEEGITVRHIGRAGQLPEALRLAIGKAESLTRHNRGMSLVVAFNYSGRAEIVDAVRRLICSTPASQIDESAFCSCLYTDGLPDVDLVIRTAGDFRISNFLLWQTAYSEWYFTNTLWPDFNEEEMDKAISEYHQRQRRLGGD